MLKGIVFDLDGTLVDSLSATFDGFNHSITSLGGRAHTPEEILHHFGNGEGEIFNRLIGPEKAEAAYAAFQAYVNENMAKVPLHPGVGELLEKIKSAGIPISIVTGRSWSTTEIILNHHGLIDRFITVIADDHVSSPKPSPEGLHLALSRMKLEPAQVMFVGDSAMDIRAARSAGSNGVAALWDWLAKRRNLEPWKPHYWAEKPGDVWDLWERLKA